MAVRIGERTGITCGKRSNGDRCVLWDDETRGDGGFEWFNSTQFAAVFGI